MSDLIVEEEYMSDFSMCMPAVSILIRKAANLLSAGGHVQDWIQLYTPAIGIKVTQASGLFLAPL